MKEVRLVGIAISLGISGVLTIVGTANPKVVFAQTTESTKSVDLNPNLNLLYLPTSPEEVKLQATQKISLEQAIALAQSNHRELQIAQLTFTRSQAVFRQAQAANAPTIAITGQLSSDRSATETFTDQRKGEIRESVNSVSTGIEANYDLFTGGKREALIAAADKQVEHDRLDVQRLIAQIQLDVALAYYDAQEAIEQVRITESAVKNAKKSVEDAITLEAGGTGARYDILRSRVQLANAEQELTQAQGQEEIARRQLAQILSISDSSDVTPSDPVKMLGEWQRSLEESIILAFQNRVEFQQQLLQRGISDQQRLASLADRSPQVSLFAGYQVLYGFDHRVSSAVDGYAVGARLRWNLFDGGAASAGAQQQEANIAIAETRFAETRNQVRLQVEKAYKTLQINQKNIKTATIALNQAKEGLDISRLRLQAGVGTQLEVSTAETELTRAESNRVRAILNYNRSRSALQRAISLPLNISQKD